MLLLCSQRFRDLLGLIHLVGTLHRLHLADLVGQVAQDARHHFFDAAHGADQRLCISVDLEFLQLAILVKVDLAGAERTAEVPRPMRTTGAWPPSSPPPRPRTVSTPPGTPDGSAPGTTPGRVGF